MSADDEIRESYEEPNLDIEDLKGFLLGKVSQGIPLGLLVKQTVVAINKLHDAADRWVRLEAHKQPSAPIWLNSQEARVLYKGLAGIKGPEARLIRQDIRDTFGLGPKRQP